jgi:hypothetical protein
MGGDHSRDSDKQKYREAAAVPEALNLKRYGKIAVIGRGGFGRVLRVLGRCGRSRARRSGGCSR